MKNAWLTIFTNRVTRFRAAQEAVAIVEFALTVPLLLFLYLGSVEVSQMITADRKVTTIAGTVGDLVSRTKGTISKSGALADYFLAAKKIITPFPSKDLTQIVSSVYVDENGIAKIDWSEAFKDGNSEADNLKLAHTKGEIYKLPATMIAIAPPKSYVIVSEASYTYPVMAGIVFDTDIRLYRENFFIPRFGEAIVKGP